nr:hypothetical protein [Geodermatophilus saharensis]
MSYAVHPAIDVAAQVSRNSAPTSRPSERENAPARQPPARTHDGESARACAPVRWSSSLSVPTWWGSFDSAEPRWTSHTVANT